jgi:predicted amidohydrolase
MKIAVISYSLSKDPATLLGWKSKLISEIRSCLRDGSKIILYPELFLMGLSKYIKCDPKDEIREVAKLIQADILPEVEALLKNTDVLLVLGTGPRILGADIFNSAPIWHDGKWSFQDKLYLTPWEAEFTSGNELFHYKFENLNTVVLICFDSEQPDLALALKKVGVDLILIPSATVNRNGSQRVNRCASARSIELGALVVTSPLVGESKCELVDHNEGRQGIFYPAQETMTHEQEQYSAYSSEEHLVILHTFNPDKIRELKKLSSETKPFLKPIKETIRIVRG